jgi:hypothetical protein
LRLQHVHGARVVVAVHVKLKSGLAVVADVLDDHVDLDVGVGHAPRIW